MREAFDFRKRWFWLSSVGTVLIVVRLGFVVAELISSEGGSGPNAEAPAPVPTATTDPGPGLPTRAPVGRPDETQAMDIDAARVFLSRDADLAAVIEAVESRDLDAILTLTMPGGDGYCGTGGRGGLPPGCSSIDDVLPSILLNQPSLRPLWVEMFREWATPLMTEAGEMRLTFATRDSRTPEGVGGEYYFVFQTESMVSASDGFTSNGLRLLAKSGAERPIQWFVFAAADTDPLNWIQSLDYENGAKYHVLITPESVRDMVGLQ